MPTIKNIPFTHFLVQSVGKTCDLPQIFVLDKNTGRVYNKNDVTYEEFERSVNVGDGATAAEKLKDYSRCDIYDENADRYVCYYEWRRK